MSSLRQATGEIWREKKEIKTFLYCPEKRGDKIKLDAFMILAKLNGKRAGRGPELR